MAEILVKASDADPAVADAFRWLRGHMVVVMEDGHGWGLEERLPKFVILKFPNVPVARVQQFIADNSGPGADATMRRVWQIQWDQLPAAARNRLASQGQLVIGVPAYYSGASDYLWSQIRAFVLNLVNQTTAPDIT